MSSGATTAARKRKSPSDPAAPASTVDVDGAREHTSYQPAHDVDADLGIFEEPEKAPLLPKLLKLRHLHMTWWQRVLFGDLPLALGLLIALADLATAWVIVVLPAAVMAMVKLHDLLAGQLAAVTPGQRFTSSR
jgi:hypothetical protein